MVQQDVGRQQEPKREMARNQKGSIEEIKKER
jgi:hypothetical protein